MRYLSPVMILLILVFQDPPKEATSRLSESIDVRLLFDSLAKSDKSANFGKKAIDNSHYSVAYSEVRPNMFCIMISCLPNREVVQGTRIAGPKDGGSFDEFSAKLGVIATRLYLACSIREAEWRATEKVGYEVMESIKD